MAASLQVLALGTSSGTVHLLDYEGNEVGGRQSAVCQKAPAACVRMIRFMQSGAAHSVRW
jgi:hypothetical protein